MRLQGREISPTRASQLALHDEQDLVREGYEFLDEKRMLLAQELLRQLDAYRALERHREEAQKTAQDSLKAAAMRHGLEELSLYPPPFGEQTSVQIARSEYLGLPVVAATLKPEATAVDDDALQAAFPSHEAEQCAEAFRALMTMDVCGAAIRSNLHRLTREYVTTERRARALENVLLPEIAVAVKQIGEHLEAAEQEETLLVRYAKQASGKKGVKVKKGLCFS